MVELNKIYNENCLATMENMPDDFVDLVVTSPPYDDLRTYHGYSFEFEKVANALFRVTKQGGTIVWIVNDGTEDYSETGTSFRQALYFKDIGFKLHDTMIWQKNSFVAIGMTKNRYNPVFDYMFIITKGRPKTFNPIMDRKNVCAGRIMTGTIREKDGTMRKMSGNGKKTVREFGLRTTIWEITPRPNGHPACFPERLAHDHIVSWSNENDIVYDPFIGSGTTAKMALLTNRKYIGSEISSEYHKMAEERIAVAKERNILFCCADTGFQSGDK